MGGGRGAHRTRGAVRAAEAEAAGKAGKAGGPAPAPPPAGGGGGPEPAWADPWALGEAFRAASVRGANLALREALPAREALELLRAAAKALQAERTVVDVAVPEGGEACVIGDTHGQLHDVLTLLEKTGGPDAGRTLVFNGDYVDRGAWGVEVLLLVLAWKLKMPHRVTLLRGNHETTSCTKCYGFFVEVLSKYGEAEGKELYRACKKVFAALPLAAVIEGVTLVLHGGLFRKPPAPRRKGKGRRRKRRTSFDEYEELYSGVPELGRVDELRKCSKGGPDPDGLGSRVTPTDVLWGDPAPTNGLAYNESRGVGLLFGPDFTEAFLRENGLRLVLRSHEGPDARSAREGMGDMMQGYTVDHKVASGMLCTVFSAPDYPEFMCEDEERYRNKAAFAVLRAPDFAAPAFVQYEAAPRPPAEPYYELYDVGDSDDEFAGDYDVQDASDLEALSDFGQDSDYAGEGSDSDMEE